MDDFETKFRAMQEANDLRRYKEMMEDYLDRGGMILPNGDVRLFSDGRYTREFFGQVGGSYEQCPILEEVVTFDSSLRFPNPKLVRTKLRRPFDGKILVGVPSMGSWRANEIAEEEIEPFMMGFPIRSMWW